MKGRYEVWMMIAVSAVMALLLVGSAAGALGQTEGKDISMEDNSSIGAASDLKNKTIYYHNQTGTVNNNADVLTMNTTMGTDQELTEWTSSGDIQMNWYLDPTLAGNLTLNGTATTYIWVNIKDASGGTNDITVEIDLWEVHPDGTEDPIASGSEYYGNIRTIFNEYSASTEIDEYNVSAGSSIRVQTSIVSSTNFDKRVAYGDAEYPSRLEVETSDYVQPETLKVLNSNYTESYSYRLGASNTTMHFNTSVVDPFGGYDIRRVNVTLLGPEGTVFYRRPMVQVTGNDTSYRSNYTYTWDYGNASEGEYTVIVSAVDNTGYYYRYPDNPGDETYGGHLESIEKKPVWIGAQRHHVHFKTLDSSNQVLEKANVSIYSDSPTPELITYNLTDTSGITNISIREGSYVIRVYWQEVMVNESTYDVTTDVGYTQAVELNCTVYDSNYTVLDNNNVPVENANIFMRHPNGTLLRFITDSNGRVELEQMARGDYSIRVEWLGREVDSRELTLDSDRDLDLNARIYYLDIKTVDPRGLNVSEVHVSVRFNDTERLADAKLTDINGELTMRLPGTEQGFGYDMYLQWRGVDIGSRENETLQSNRYMEIELDLYYVDFHTYDKMGQDLENANLNVYNLETAALANSGETNVTGNLTLRLPIGEHEFFVSWRGIQVAKGTFNVTADEDIEIECSVYHVEYKAVDSRDIPLQNARITVSHPDVGLLTSDVTDDTGKVSMRLPGVPLDVTASWRGVDVYAASIDIGGIDATEPVLLECNVYYLEVGVDDDENQSLENALVELYNGGTYLDEGITDQNGTTDEMRLPGTEMSPEMDVKVYWKDIKVYDGMFPLESNKTENLTVAVYHVNFTAQDTLGEPIDGARLRVSHGDNVLFTDLTSDEGNASSRIPGATNLVTLQWRHVMVYSEQMLFDHSGEYLLEVDDVYHVTFNVTDSRGERLDRASLEFYVDGNRFTSGVTGSEGSLTIRVPTPHDQAGEIDIYGEWRDVSVYEDNLTVDSNSDEEINAAVYYFDYTVLDSRNIPVENAKVVGRHMELPDDQNVITDRYTDENGHILFRLPRGPQEFTVDWKGIMIHQESFDLTGYSEEVVNADVYYHNIQANDNAGEPLESALVRITYYDSLKLYHSDYTNASGEIEVRIPAAPWEMEIKWMDTVIYDDDYNVSSDADDVQISTDVYHLSMEVVDNGGEPLTSAHVRMTYADTREFYHSGYTNSSGNLDVRIPIGDWNVEIEWKGKIVHEEEYEVPAETDLEITADVYYLSMHVVDEREEPLESAEVTITDAGTSVFYTSMDTNATGDVEIRIPIGDWNVEIEWKGKVVHESERTVDGTTQNDVDISADVYYLTMHVMDERDEPLESAEVRLADAGTSVFYTSMDTNATGDVEIRIPIGDWNVEIEWEDKIVYKSDRTVNATTQNDVDISADVYYLTMHVVDDEGKALESAEVRLTDAGTGVFYSSKETSTSGDTEIRIPIGDWNIEIEWKDTIVHEGDRTVNGTTENDVEITTDVYYLTVITEDKDGESLNDVHVRVTNSDQSWTNYTSNGEAEFRLPARDDYTIEASYRTTYLLTDIDVGESQNVTLTETGENSVKFDDYPIPVYQTNLFYLVLVLIALIALLVILRHWKKETEPAGEELEEESEEEEMFGEEEEAEEEEMFGEEDEAEEEDLLYDEEE
ncbi:MAG: carboxypeptidase regulatory-like domain-containing protein [Candidatus Thermoplasmatota archaeon]|nr:carboxypeptidase regulatory-like domain-containing protein [Candidatus Thermoplasmatota archaeon]